MRGYLRDKVINNIAPLLNVKQLEQLLSIILANDYTSVKIHQIVKLSPYLPSDIAHDLLLNAFSEAKNIDKNFVDDNEKEEALHQLAPVLVEHGLIDLAFKAIENQEGVIDIVECIAKLLRFVSNDYLNSRRDSIFRMAFNVDTNDMMSYAFYDLYDYIDCGWAFEIFEYADIIGYENDRAEMLLTIANKLEDEFDKEEYIEITLESILDMDEMNHPYGLKRILPYLNKEQIDTLFTHSKESGYFRPYWIKDLILYLDSEQINSIIDDVISTNKEINLVNKNNATIKIACICIDYIEEASREKLASIIYESIPKNKINIDYHDELINLAPYLDAKHWENMLDYRYENDMNPSLELLAKLIPYIKGIDESDIEYILEGYDNRPDLYALMLSSFSHRYNSTKKAEFQEKTLSIFFKNDNVYSSQLFKNIYDLILNGDKEIMYHFYSKVFEPLRHEDSRFVLKNISNFSEIIYKLGGVNAVENTIDVLINSYSLWYKNVIGLHGEEINGGR